MSYVNDRSQVEKALGQKVVDVKWQDELRCADLVLEDGTEIVIHQSSRDSSVKHGGEKEGKVDSKCVEKDYTRLLTSVQDLLAELRIDERCLMAMSEGYSPDYPGVPINEEVDKPWANPHCKVQISKVVAVKLIGAGVLDHLREG